MSREFDTHRAISINGTPYYLSDEMFTHEQDNPHWFLLCCNECGEYGEGISGVTAASLTGWRDVTRNEVGDDWFTHEGECPACLREMRREVSIPLGMLF